MFFMRYLWGPPLREKIVHKGTCLSMIYSTLFSRRVAPGDLEIGDKDEEEEMKKKIMESRPPSLLSRVCCCFGRGEKEEGEWGGLEGGLEEFVDYEGQPLLEMEMEEKEEEVKEEELEEDEPFIIQTDIPREMALASPTKGGYSHLFKNTAIDNL